MDKGVVCQTCPEDQMPIDAEGNRADIVMDPNATISRMNLGRVYEQYFSAAARDVHKLICRVLNITPNTEKEHALIYLQGLSHELKDEAWNHLLHFYKIMNTEMFNWFKEGKVRQDPDDFLAHIVAYGVYVYLPSNHQNELVEMVKACERSTFRPCYGPVTYVGNSGRRVTTKEKVRIGSMYFILLEKIGDDWSAVSSAKLQHFGVPAQLTKQDKYSKPARLQPVRGAGEAEVRIYASYTSERFVAELMDRNNNPKAHKELVMSILKADQPSNIPIAIDRVKIPFGSSKPLQLVKHLCEVSGFQFKYKPYQVTWNK